MHPNLKCFCVGVVEFESTQPKHLIYSQAHLSNCGALPIAPTTLFYNYPRESSNQYRTSELVRHLYLVRLCYNPFIYEKRS